ncbi:two-component system response regulator BtsR [Chitinilyticum piscinae]|uniref:Two-component system response regulator BtsR n=1 Tax=Chitinilyticum piscinae TaxID=2866724 RepID=A0A8J7FJ15_9NEIS|nr:two-component system response regulator BtsR [Chitinilyticum piscinae]MBE9609000.1 two-component system response regulator BtsR [Chitinilyticum piscinae]
MQVLLVDDEPLARDELRALLAAHPDVSIAAEAGNAIEGMQLINRLNPDVIFLDIQMPKISGLELVSMFDPEHVPHIVFVTAFDEHAIRAFDAHAFDYLLKPVEPARLARTLARLRRSLPAGAPDYQPLINLQPLQQLPCHGHNRIVLLPLAEVESVIARLSGIYLVDRDGQEHFTELTLKTLEERTPLLRCHRQHLVHPQAIAEIRLNDSGGADLITRHGRSVPVSRRFLKSLKDALGV